MLKAGITMEVCTVVYGKDGLLAWTCVEQLLEIISQVIQVTF